MYTVGLDLSRNQINKLKKGAKARVKKGMGCNLIVRPETYSILSRAFRRNKGVDISLSPEEIELNMLPSPEEQAALIEQTNMDMASSDAMGAGLNWKKIGKTLKKEGIKLAKKEGPKLLKKFAKEAYKAYNAQDDDDIEAYGQGLGAGFGGLFKAHIGDIKNAVSQATQANYRASKATPAKYMQSGLTGGAMPSFKMPTYKPAVMPTRMPRRMPTEMRKAVMPPGLRNRRCPMTTGIIGNGLNLVEGKGLNMGAQHQALQPQPYSANYHFKFMLPPQYQDLQDITGEGLYL